MSVLDKKFVIGEDINKKKVKIDVSELQYRPSAYGLCFKDGKILLSRFRDGYDFPGGGVEVYETLEEGLLREFWEETGMKITPGKLLHVSDGFFKFPEKGDPFHTIQIYYLVHNPKGKITDKNFDAFEKKNNFPAEWVDVKNVGKIKFYNGVDSPRLIKEALKK